MRQRRMKAFALILLFAMVFAAAISIGTGEDVFGARRKNTQYSLAGAKYQLYTNSTCTTAAQDINGNNAILTTDANGNSNTLEMEPGTYYAKEITASKGFKLDVNPDTGAARVIPITITTSNTSSNPAQISSTEPPVYGYPNFKVYKSDITGERGWQKMIGAEFTVKYYDVATKAEIANAAPMDTWVFKTRKMEGGDMPGAYYAGFDFETDTPEAGSSSFYVVDGRRVLPCGWFTIEETNAPAEMALTDRIYYGQIKQNNPGENAITVIEGSNATGSLEVPVSIEDEPQKVSIAVDKKSAADGAELASCASLDGAKYEVYYDGSGSTELVGTITTDANGHGELTENTVTSDGDKSLKPGNYIVKEIKASPGFVLDKYTVGEDGSVSEVSGAIDVKCDYDDDGTATSKTVEGYYRNGQHTFKASIQADNTAVFNYTVTSKEEPTRTYIKKTDATTTEEIPGATLQIFSLNEGSSGDLIEQWVSTEEDHIVYGLPSGTYLLREITAPHGYDVAEDIEFAVEDGEVVTNVEMKDKPVEISTFATDNATGTHQGTFSEVEKIDDKVTIKGLNEGWKYELKGVLMDKETGETLKDSDGNDISAETGEFTATGSEMEKTLTFSVDSSQFDTKKAVVAFEKLFRTETAPVNDPSYPPRDDEDVPIELAAHEDIDDADQTVTYGGIVETVATDAKTKSHNMLGEEGAVIKDIVKYENLQTGVSYTVEGELFDKTSGKLTGIKATTSFKPEEPDGEVEVEFKFDGTQFTGHTLVAYETLLVNNIEINKHEEPDDEDQTIYVPKIETVAVNPECNEHVANAGSITVKDTVTYKNLIPGRTYTLKGTLQYRDGLFKKLKTVMKDGKPLTATATITPTEPDGTEEVTFAFDATDLAGKTTVVFEDLYDGEYIIATHADPDDEDQSVHIPKIWTKIGKRSGAYVTDNAHYENLVPGKTYVMKGWFVKQKGGEKVEGSDGSTTFTPTSADGSIAVKLKNIEGSGNVVAFEECYIIDETGKEVLVGSHKNPKDRKQLYKKTGKIVVSDKDAFKNGVNTGDQTMLVLWISFFTTALLLLTVLTIRTVKKRRSERE